jgi:hypothetical protein
MKILKCSLLVILLMCSPAFGAKLRSLHCVMVGEERHEGTTRKNEMEFWMKDDRVRAESSLQGQKAVEIKTGGFKYVFAEGRTDGLKLPAESAAWGQLDWLRELDTFKRAATKLSIETVEGILCDKYQRVGDKVTTTLWISHTNGFTVKAIWRTSEGSAETVSTMIFKSVELNPDLPDRLFQPPASVTFRAEPRRGAN